MRCQEKPLPVCCCCRLRCWCWSSSHFSQGNDHFSFLQTTNISNQTMISCHLQHNIIVVLMMVTMSSGFLSATQHENSRGNTRSARWSSLTTKTRISLTQGDNAASAQVMEVRVGDLLSDLPTPCLLLELSLAEKAAEEHYPTMTLDEVLANVHLLLEEDPDDDETTRTTFDGSLFVHTKIISTAERDATNAKFGSGKSLIIGDVDASPEQIPGGAYLGIGLANHHVGGYYWARGMGIGAALPAHGIFFRESSCSSSSSAGCVSSTGELYWKKRGPGQDATETTEESSNSNDGKRSEWADFVAVGETVQLVPENAARVLQSSSFFIRLLGVRRIGRPLGADPIVEKIWTKQEGTSGWIVE